MKQIFRLLVLAAAALLCQGALAQCLGDATCLESLVCLNLCNGAPDETACQIKCGDRYSDESINTFNSCAVSEQKCVPQRVDEGEFEVVFVWLFLFLLLFVCFLFVLFCCLALPNRRTQHTLHTPKKHNQKNLKASTRSRRRAPWTPPSTSPPSPAAGTSPPV